MSYKKNYFEIETNSLPKERVSKLIDFLEKNNIEYTKHEIINLDAMYQEEKVSQKLI